MKICLNVICKNEEKVIKRMLKSVEPIIDYYVICDTGSTDNTINIINDFLKDKEGVIIIEEWKDFSTARNKCIEQSKGDYILWIDSDEELIIDKRFNKNNIKDCDAFVVETIYGSMNYFRKNLFKINNGYEWTGPIHEIIESKKEKKVKIIGGLKVLVRPEGSSWSDPDKYKKHAIILSEYTKIDKDPRWLFYTAQSYRDCKKYEESIKWYKKRYDDVNGFSEERWYSLYMIAKLKHLLGQDAEKDFMYCYNFDRVRAEPLKDLFKIYLKNEDYEAAMLIGKLLKSYINRPKRSLYIDVNLYDYESIYFYCLILGVYSLKKELKIYFDILVSRQKYIKNDKIILDIKKLIEKI